MNKILILAITLLLTTDYTKAQHVEANNTVVRKQINKATKQSPFKITKGYYAIYRNAEKLNHQPVKVLIDSSNVPDKFTKGFYAIGSNHTQLHKGGNSLIATVPKRPIAAKGYYSIKQPQPAVNRPEENLMKDSVELD